MAGVRVSLVLCLVAVVLSQTEANTVKYILYYRSLSPVGTYTLSSVRRVPAQYFSGSATTYFVIHGWKMTPDGMNSILKELIPQNGPIFMVDWNDWAKKTWYPSACSSTAKVGADVASFIRGLEARTHARRERMHVIGFSLGGKVSAATGASLGNRKLMRITGLDTPLYCMLSPNPKLDPGDATFVDTIRTTFLSGVFSQTQGHADFWTCKNLKCVTVKVQNLHKWALYLFANSINRSDCRLRGRAFRLSKTRRPQCTGTYGTMGFHASKPSRDTMYYVQNIPDQCKRELGRHTLRFIAALIGED